MNDVSVYGLCAVLCYSAFYMRWLTAWGCVTAYLMALVFIYAGLDTFILPLILLLGGTLLSKLNLEAKEKNGRTAVQVLANGLVGCICLLAYTFLQHSEFPFFLAYLVSFSISICDTFSSEIGKFFKGRTFDILSFKPVVPGLSGGVSVMGTLGGIAGAGISALIAYGVFDISTSQAVQVCVFGCMGMLLDSVLGSVLQAKYINGYGVIGESPVVGGRLMKGYTWCNNDVVNILSNALVVVVLLLFS
jgi:uncharacterized protein (TIGR00297 family)